MTSIVDILPLEVIEHIIDILALDDYQSGPHNPLQFPNVKACALTCKAFYPRSRYQRFRAIKIYDTHPFVEHSKGSASLEDFERFAKTYPHYAREVRELHYSLRGRSYRPLIEDAVPKNLSNLQSLVLTSYRGSMDWIYNVPWHNPEGKAEKDPLLQIIHLPTLLSLKLTRTYNFRPSDLLGCPNLQCLSLQSVTTWPEDDERTWLKHNVPNPIKGGRSIRLRRLEVGGSAITTVAEMMKPAGEDELPILDLQDVKELEVKGGLQEKYFPCTKMIFKHARQIQSLRIEVGRQESFENMEGCIPLILPSLDTLKHLSFDLYLPAGGAYDPDKDNFRRQVVLLTFLGFQRNNQLKSVQLQIRIRSDLLGLFPDEVWIFLRELFLFENTWPALTHLDLALIVQGRRPIRKLIRRSLSTLPDQILSGLFSSQKGFKFTFFSGKESEYVPRNMESWE